MASRLDEKYIENLSHFSKSLESVVELLEAQSRTHPTDVVNQLLKNFDPDKITKMSQDIEEIKNSTAEINKRNQQILEEIKAIRKQKESGLFEKVENKENKDKIVDGIKTVILIAGGVLAIGMAFKLVGKVDFLSVIALGVGIYVIAKTYENLAGMKDLTPRQVLTISAMLPAMGLGTLISAFILAKMPTITPAKLLTAIGVSASMGVIAYFMGMLADKFQIRNVFKFLLLPLILPIMALGVVTAAYFLARIPNIRINQLITAIGVGIAMIPVAYAIGILLEKVKKITFKQIIFAGLILPVMASGIVASGFILQQMPIIGTKQLISATLVGVALIPTAFAFSLIVKVLKDKNVTVAQLLAATAVVPLIAGGLVLSSMILQYFKPLIQPWKIVVSAIVIGIAILAMTPALWIMSKIKPKDLLTATIGIVGVAAALTLASIIMKAFMPVKSPLQVVLSSIAIGVSTVVMGAAIWVMTKLFGTDEKALETVLIGAGVMLIVAATLAATSWIVGLGSYDNYPSFGWTFGVGISLIAFGVTMGVIGALMEGSVGTGYLLLLAGAGAILMIAATVVATSYILGAGNYAAYPSLGWAVGVGLTMVAFGLAMIPMGLLLPFVALGALSMRLVAHTIVAVAEIVGKGDYSRHPSVEWARSVGLLMVAFGYGMVTLGKMSIGTIIKGTIGVLAVAASILATDMIISKGEYQTFPSSDWQEAIVPLVAGFAAGIALLGDLGLTTVIKGALSAIIVAGVIVAVDFILSKGKYETYPAYEWQLGTATAMVAFGYGLTLLGTQLTTVAQGAIAAVIVAATIVAVDWILSKGDYTKYPSWEWQLYTVTTMTAFGIGLTLLGSQLPMIILGAVAALAVAATIVAVDWILAKGDYTKYPSWEWQLYTITAMGAYGLGLSLLGPQLPFVILGAVSALVVAGTILAVDWILSKGDYTKYPDWNWQLATYATMTAFGIGLALMGPELPLIILGAIAALAVAGSILAVDWILSKGDYTKYPSFDWAKGVGLSMLMFTGFAVGVGAIALVGFGLGAVAFLAGLALLIPAAATIVEVARILGGGTYGNYPSPDWAEGVGHSILYFSSAVKDIMGLGFWASIFGGGMKIEDFSANMIGLAEMLKTVGLTLDNAGTSWSKYPKKEWADGVGVALMSFAKTMESIMSIGKSWWQSITGGGGMSIDDFIKNMKGLSLAMVEVGMTFDIFGAAVKWSNYPKKEWADGVGGAIGGFVNAMNIISQIGEGWFTDGMTVDTFIASMKQLANAIIDVGKIFDIQGASVKWANYPKKDWADGVGGALAGFTTAIAAIRGIGEGWFTDGMTVESFGDGMISLAKSLINVGVEFTKGGEVYKVFPKAEWSQSIAGSVTEFAKGISALEEIDSDLWKNAEFATALGVIATAMISAGKSFTSAGELWVIYPKIEWSKAISGSVVEFTKGISALEGIDSDMWKDGDFIVALNTISTAMINTGKAFTSAGELWGIYPKIEWSKALSDAVVEFTKGISALDGIDSDLWKDDGFTLALRTLSTAMINTGKAFTGAGDLWTIYPKSDWSKTISESIIQFTKGISALDTIDSDLWKNDGFVVALRTLSTAMITAGREFTTAGNLWGIYPKLEWSQSISQSVVGFAKGISILDEIDSSLWEDGTFITALNTIATAIINTGRAFTSAGSLWGSYPSLEWSTNVAQSLLSFSKITHIGSVNPESLNSAIAIANAMTIISGILTIGQFSKYPGEDWSSAVITNIEDFYELSGDVADFVDGSILSVATSIVLTSLILITGQYNKYPNEDWSSAVLTNIEDFYELSGDVADFTASSLLLIASTISLTSVVLSSGQYIKYPNEEWSDAVLGNIKDFYELSGDIADFKIGSLFSIAWTIVNTSNILLLGSYTKYPNEEWSDIISTNFIDFYKLSNKISDFIPGSLTTVASTIVLVSLIISLGNYTKYPSKDWADIIYSNFTDFTKLSIKTAEFNQGALTTIASTITLISVIIGLGNYTKYPSKDWADIIYSNFIDFTKLSIKTAEFNPTALFSIANAILTISNIIAGGDYTKYPEPKWVDAIYENFTQFNKLSDKISEFDSSSLYSVSWAIVYVSQIISKGAFDIYPSTKWIDSIVHDIKKFSTLSTELTGFTSNDAISVASTIVSISTIISTGTYDKYPDKKWIDAIYSVFLKMYELSGILGSFDSINILYVAETIVKLSNLLKGTTYSDYPSKNWVDIISYDFKLINELANDMQSFTPDQLLLIAKAIVDISNILKGSTYDVSPSKDWTGDVIYGFTKLNDISDIQIAGENLTKNALLVVSLSNILKLGDYTVFPDDKWIKAITTAFTKFYELSSSVKDFDSKDILNISTVMLNLATAFKLADFKKYPDDAWMKGVINVFNKFSTLAGQVEVDNNIIAMSNMIARLATAFSDIKWSYPDEVWTKSVIKSFLEFNGLKLAAIDTKLPLMFTNMMVDINKSFTGIIWVAPNLEWITSIVTAFTKLNELNNLLSIDVNSLLNKAEAMVKLSNLFLNITWMSPSKVWIQSVVDAFLQFNTLNSIVSSDVNILLDKAKVMIDLNKLFAGVVWVAPNFEWTNSVTRVFKEFESISSLGKLNAESINSNAELMINLNKLFAGVVWNKPNAEWITSIVETFNRFNTLANTIKIGDAIIDNANIIIKLNQLFTDIVWKYPDIQWAISVIDAFTRFNSLSNINTVNSANLVENAEAMIKLNQLFTNVVWKYPDIIWTNIIVEMFEKFNKLSNVTEIDSKYLIDIANTAILLNKIFTGVVWNSPNLIWIDNIVTAFTKFGTIPALNINNDSINNVARLMVSLSNIFTNTIWASPDINWINSISSGFLEFDKLSSITVINTDVILNMARTIVGISNILSGVIFESVIDTNWINSVVQGFSSLNQLANSMSNFDSAPLYSMSNSIIGTASILKQLGLYQIDSTWVENFTTSVSSIASAISGLDSSVMSGVYTLGEMTEKLYGFVTGILELQSIGAGMFSAGSFYSMLKWEIWNIPNWMPKEDVSKGLDKVVVSLRSFETIQGDIIATQIEMISKAVGGLAFEINRLNTDSISSLMNLSGALLTISVIDKENLSSVLTTIAARKNEIKQVFDDGTNSWSNKFKSQSTNAEPMRKGEVATGPTSVFTGMEDRANKAEDENMTTLIGFVQNIDTNIQTIANNSQPPKSDEYQTGSPTDFNKTFSLGR